MTAVDIPIVKLQDETQIPVMGFGTGTTWFKTSADSPYSTDLVTILKEAINKGYRLLDTAEDYRNEAELGQAIRECGVPREQLFVTTKVALSVFEGSIDSLPKAIDDSLERLGLEYVDLYLLHSPYLSEENRYVEKDVAREWEHMEAVQRSGKAKAIGISGFRRAQVEALLKTAEIRPVVNQIQFHPYLQGAPAYAKWLQGQRISVQGYMGLAPLTHLKGNHLESTLKELAEKYAVSESAVLTRWELDQGVIVLHTTSKAERIEEHFQVLGLKLDADDAAKITNIGQSHHIIVPILPLYSGNDLSPYQE